LTPNSYILKHNDERGMTHAEIGQTSGTFVIAGSETSATLLSGATYYLLQNPSWLAKLKDEIRTAFATESEISFAPLSQLTILDAILNETFRMYPPVPSSLPRIVPKGGASVAGTYIAADARIGIPQYVAYRSPRNFTDPEKYAPERFLGDPQYADDKRSVIQPFSTGPRNCIGQSLAWAEIRTILARLVWHFDMEAVDTSTSWEKQKVFVLWEKPSLMVRLKARDTVGAA
jgi:cytochrome P450